ncbi:MAG: hypothetical protein RBR53_05375 [Desulforegulaceae bacterium]|nr:hypothetical protein [Desulforegulaceae bacterium]
MKKLILIFILIFIFPFSLSAKDYNRGKLPKVAQPDWVYPSNRKNYQGYEKKRLKKLNNPDWKHSTNRDTGKNKGGGSVYYYDYQSIKQRTSGK